METRQFWRLDRVEEETGLCARAIYQGMVDRTFPRNFPISKQARAWASDEVESWKAAKLAQRDEYDRAAAAERGRARATKSQQAKRAKRTEAA